VDHHDRRAGAGHHPSSGGRACLGRRRYTVFGTSTLGGFLGMGLRTRAWTGLFGFPTGLV
jgi:hypothetical protein